MEETKLSKSEILINSVMGLCGESGEAIDIVKKWMAQGHELDKEHLAKELGDIAWYLAEAATALDMSLEDIFQANIDKLKMRYPDQTGLKQKNLYCALKKIYNFLFEKVNNRNFSNPWIDCAMVQEAEEAETFVKIASKNQ
mgnify:CR=1 FL=1